LSLDYTFPLGTGLYGLVEHFYNQNVASRSALEDLVRSDTGLTRLAERESPQLVTVARNQTAVELGYDLTPLLRAQVLWIHDWNGASEAVAPSLVWSARSNLEITGGIQVYAGSDGAGQYGGLPPLYFARVDVYF
ncbi:MAG: hypothetical protein ACHQ6T_15510, partial [Myxococcota bacterium]